jgi:starch synthase
MAKKREKPQTPATPARPAASKRQPKAPAAPNRKTAAAKPAGAARKAATARPAAARTAKTVKSAKAAAPQTGAVKVPRRSTRGARAQNPPEASRLHIVMVAPEMHPFATSGGLSEVVGALPAALEQLGHRVTVIVPRYRRVAISPAGSADLGSIIDFGTRRFVASFFRRQVSERVAVVFVDVPELFDREELYGGADGDYPDNALRFAVFSRAAVEYLRMAGERPSVIHAHDWHSALVPVYQKMHFSLDPMVGGVPVVFTIHNLAFQGVFPADTLDEIGLTREVLHVEAMEYHGHISYLKAGINFSERITTVSPTYAREILTAEGGFGLDGVLARRSKNLAGILNGIDVQRWNPASDPFLSSFYSAEDLDGKKNAKRALLEHVGLDTSERALARPLIGLVSRLTDQKGFDLVASAARELVGLDAAWVMLGSGERRYEELWTNLAQRHPRRVSATIGYDERLEHLITAGADAFLMPSRFEPCGLNQLNSLRYGTLPIVRATGGLTDTVEPASASNPGTGFRFEDYTPDALLGAVRQALDTYHQAERWRSMQEAAMAKDYSWDVSAREYVKVYRPNS